MLLAIALISCAPSRAQTQAAQYATAATSPPVLLASPQIASKPDYFELDASVVSQSNSPIRGLKQADFIADASGVHLPIAFFRETPRMPISIGILVDTSGSMKPKLATVQHQLDEFINSLGPSDEVFLIAFSSKPRILHALTVDHRAVVENLSQLGAFGQTSIYDSIVLAIGEFGTGHYGSKQILLITDGIDNTSTVTEQGTVLALKATGVTVYAIGIGDPNAKGSLVNLFTGKTDRVDAKALQDIVHRTGGEAFIVPPSGNGFTVAIETISRMLNHTYAIGLMIPPGTPIASLHLTVANHPDVVVTTHVINPPLP